MTNPTKFLWTDPTTNVDGSPIAAGEITGYQIGVRPASGTAGTYPMLTPVAGATATSEAFTALSSLLVPGSYAAAILAVGPVDSAYSAEVNFTIAPPVPSAPTNFGVA
ncbi:MAG: hypothetical protein RB191_04590 [Terriglobia bacterium]|nr:hypothetical protein [Terriglobia bacterium]